MGDSCAPDAESRPSDVGEEQERPRTPVETRTVALAALVALALIVLPFALYAGAAFFIPLFVSLFMSYALSPVVDWMERCRVPRAVGATITMMLVITVAALGVQQAINGATDVLEELPQSVQKLRHAVTSWERDGQGALKQVRKTADELQKLADATTAAGAKSALPSPTPAPESTTLVAAGTAGMAIFMGQLVSVLFLTTFLLGAGDLFRRRLMRAMGPSLTMRKKALQILRQIHQLSQRYFALVLVMNIAIGIITTAGLYLLHVRHPMFWGITIAILHTIPYLGTAAVTASVGLLAYMQFESGGMAIAAAAVPLAAATLIGIGLQTVLMGRAARMNAVAIFVALLFFGMLWGGWGLLLAFPIMATARIVFGEIERLRPVALLMGD
jgi:predicted PurR-regulated permease PerM